MACVWQTESPILAEMGAKPVFTDEQYEILHAAARRVWKNKFEREGKTQKEMAYALGITQQSVSNLLKGTYRPGLKVATDIAILDGRELEDLVGDYVKPTSVNPGPAGRGSGLHSSPFANLDVCVQFFASTKSWSPWTIAAARAGFFGPSDFAPPEWAGKLDALEKAIEPVRKKLV